MYEYTGSVWMKRYSSVRNKLKSEKGIKPNQIVKITFDKRTKGPYRFKALVNK